MNQETNNQPQPVVGGSAIAPAPGVGITKSGMDPTKVDRAYYGPGDAYADSLKTLSDAELAAGIQPETELQKQRTNQPIAFHLPPELGVTVSVVPEITPPPAETGK
jgi:hypothetical protein